MKAHCRRGLKGSADIQSVVLRLSVAVAFFLVGSAAQAQLASFGAVGGVYVDPEGMLKQTSSLSEQELREKLATQPVVAASPAMAASSPLRKISLRRLEQAVARFHETDQALPAECQYLAGMMDVRYVLIFPEAGDVVLAGPAEGWQRLPAGDVVGLRSNRPVLQLDDLVVALRYAFAARDADGFLGCSIEPTEKGVQAHGAFLRGLGSMNGSRVAEVMQGLEQAVGPQDIHVYGVEPATRFALQMVAADYRLKRIALAHDASPAPKLPSYLDLAERALTGGQQRQHRWWFVGHYDAIRRTDDRLAYEFEGQALKVDTASSLMAGAQKRDASKPARAAKTFADLATKYLPEMARSIPAVAELQNLVGLAVASVLIHRQAESAGAGSPDAADGTTVADRDAARGRWRPAHFLDPTRCPVARFAVPRQTPSLANVRFVKGQFWMFSVSGGVEIDPVRMAAEEYLKPASGPRLGEARLKAAPPAVETLWWWD